MRLSGRRRAPGFETAARHDRAGSAAPLTFAIVCVGRVGSEHLVALLDSHDDVCCFGELFNPITSDYALHRGGDHRAYLRERARDVDARVVGCKLTWPSLHSFPMLFDLFHDPALRVVRLVRPNYLAMHVSVCHAVATGTMHATDADPESVTIRIDRHRCYEDLFGFFAIDRILDEVTRHNPVFRLEYERLGDPTALRDLQEFLGVRPTELSSPQRRIVRRPLHESIENYDEVVDMLQGTAWEPFLEGEQLAG